MKRTLDQNIDEAYRPRRLSPEEFAAMVAGHHRNQFNPRDIRQRLERFEITEVQERYFLSRLSNRAAGSPSIQQPDQTGYLQSRPSAHFGGSLPDRQPPFQQQFSYEAPSWTRFSSNSANASSDNFGQHGPQFLPTPPETWIPSFPDYRQINPQNLLMAPKMQKPFDHSAAPHCVQMFPTAPVGENSNFNHSPAHPRPGTFPTTPARNNPVSQSAPNVIPATFYKSVHEYKNDEGQIFIWLFDKCCESRTGILFRLPEGSVARYAFAPHTWTPDDIEKWKTHRMPPKTMPPATVLTRPVLLFNICAALKHTNEEVEPLNTNGHNEPQPLIICAVDEQTWYLMSFDQYKLDETFIQFRDKELIRECPQEQPYSIPNVLNTCCWRFAEWFKDSATPHQKRALWPHPKNAWLIQWAGVTTGGKLFELLMYLGVHQEPVPAIKHENAEPMEELEYHQFDF